MESTGYVTLSRQTALMHEMQVVANNIANASTTGYRQERLIFSEFVKRQPNQDWLSMTRAAAYNTSSEQGGLTRTEGTFDFAIEGDGYFMLETPAGIRLTRAGSFAPNASGELVNPGGLRLLDEGGTPVFVPPDATGIHVAADGTISSDGRPLGKIGVYQPLDPLAIQREGGVMFRANDDVEPVENPRLLQGFLEDSNVNSISQIARLIEIQRAYEMGQSFLQAEDERIRAAIKSLIP